MFQAWFRPDSATCEEQLCPHSAIVAARRRQRKYRNNLSERAENMTDLLEVARKGRANALARIGGFPCGNTTAAGSGTRFRSAARHENVTFISVRGRD
jgi:hypothetical protein